LLVGHVPDDFNFFMVQSIQVIFLLLCSLLVYYIVELLHFGKLFLELLIFLLEEGEGGLKVVHSNNNDVMAAW
jgi:hypothetical protein